MVLKIKSEVKEYLLQSPSAKESDIISESKNLQESKCPVTYTLIYIYIIYNLSLGVHIINYLQQICCRSKAIYVTLLLTWINSFNQKIPEFDLVQDVKQALFTIDIQHSIYCIQHNFWA